MKSPTERTDTLPPDLPDQGLSRPIRALIAAVAVVIRAARGWTVLADAVVEAARARAGVAPPYRGMDRATARRYEASVDRVLSVPASHGLQLLHGEDLDDAVSLIVACGVSSAFVMSEPGGWATTTERLTELAKDVPTPRVDAALRLLDEHRIELVRRAR